MYPIDYFIALDDFFDKKLGDLESAIERTPKKRVGSLTIDELCSVSAYPHGLYLLFGRENELCYIGKATSRSFIERIPSHFDPREEAWFNTLPRRVMRTQNISAYDAALEIGLSLQILLIGVQQPSVTPELEKVLRTFLLPKFNARKGEFSASALICDLFPC
ncbi:MAG: hypothetical protein WBO10_09805 [Pyrinomonadaceae bacterium]